MHVIAGLVLSTTVTFWLHSAKLPQASVARHVRMASKVFPQRPIVFVVVPTIVTVTVPQVSDAVGGSKLHALVHSTVLSAMHVMTGLVLSWSVIVCTHWALLPQSSVAVQVRAITLVLPQPAVTASL